jgi:hypothetical protein
VGGVSLKLSTPVIPLKNGIQYGSAKRPVHEPQVGGYWAPASAGGTGVG